MSPCQWEIHRTHLTYHNFVPQIIKLFLKKKHKGRYLYLYVKIYENMLEYPYIDILTNKKEMF